MTASIERFGPVDKSSEVAQALRRDGAAIVQGALPAEVMDLLAAKLRPHLDAQEIGGGSFFGHRRRSVAGIYAMGPEFAEHLMLNERVLEVTDEILRPEFPMAASASKQARSLGLEEEDLEAAAKRLFEPPDPVTGPFCHHYRVNVCSAMEVWGQGRNQPLHREMGNYLPYLQHDPDMPEYIVAAIWAVTDFRADNGATRVVPGSHRWPSDRRAEKHEVAQAEMPKGSVLFWTAKALHGLGASRVDEPRTGIINTFVVNWLAQEENQYLTVPPEVARTLPERAQRLLGYRASPTIAWAPGLDQENMLRAGKSGNA
jgi:ectoine hydroxylase-related dioxygenase (phytanoyl-CoA dioxygenase family)